MTSMSNQLKEVYAGKTVLVTGHTGFKGSWLSIWLTELGAKVIGYSLDPPTTPNNFTLAQLDKKIVDIRGDLRDKQSLFATIETHKPEIIFHLGAQAIVLKSYASPKETFDINVGGTVNVLEATREFEFIKTVVCITSDKCYKDQDFYWGYRETDTLGGHDPYSASKGMAELVIASYRASFFSDKRDIAVASARAGNVIGGGDFADYRLVPDAMRALLANKPIQIRNPQSTRPWQHVLVPLSGYLVLGAQLHQKRRAVAEAWNFGPLENKGLSTQEVADKLIALWGSGKHEYLPVENPKKEARLLRLSWEKAAQHLGWAPAYPWNDALKATVDWFKEYRWQKEQPNPDTYSLCVKQILEYTEKARELKIDWAM